MHEKIKFYKNPKGFFTAALIIALTLAAPEIMASGGNIENDGTSHIGRTLVITGQSAVPSSYCGVAYSKYQAVVIAHDGKTSRMTQVGISAGAHVRPGKTFEVVAQRPCGKDRLFLDIREK